MNGKERLSSPLSVYAVYMLASLLVIAGYRWFFPGAAEPLEPFFLKWRIVTAFIDFAALYPALAFSALVIPFGLKEHSGNGYAGGTFVGDKSFSPRFLQYLTWPVITACVAAALYGVVFFVLLPIAGNMKQSMISRAGLFESALEKAGAYAAAGEWAEASRFIAIGEGIWSDNEEIKRLKANYNSGISSYRERIREEAKAEEEENPLSSVDARRQAETAFAEERWYDAHWLATLAERLARPGSAEIPAAQALAASAWNKITELAPNAREKERYALYRLKLDGYNAMLEQDWINAYYTFRELSVLTPKDPDVEQYLENSTRGLAEVAFFVDEIDLALGTVFRNPVFSLPVDSKGEGRIVLRFSSVALLPDYAYVWEPELVAVDKDGLFLYRVRSDYGKIVPVSISTLEGEPREQAALLLRVLDRADSNKRWEPVWTNEAGEAVDSGDSQILLSLSFDDFILLSRVMEGPDNLGLRELFDAEKELNGYGFVPEIFRAEIVRRLSEPVFFLPLSVFALFLGWCFRAKKKPRYVYVPMLGLLPLVFYHVSLFLRSVFNNLAIWFSLSVGFPAALICFVAASALCFVLALVVLAAQHG
ncbi:MAG: hypothetical protein LBG26_03105 [Treponema sp.]|jgi:lipopolysaccharide export LptBFGC system permease protein LptF|nr:hypothetical protein [Treponema sp.]